MLMHLVAGKFVTQALAAAAELNLAEQLVDGPRTAQEIAGPMGVHAPSLDWDDARCERILSNSRAAMAPGGRVLVVEMVVPPPGIPSFARLIDLEMLAISSNGKERKEHEFAELFAKAGLVLARVVPTQSPYSVLEAFRA